MKLARFSLGLLLLSLSKSTWACSVCFGGGDSPWRRGYFWGVLILLLLPPLLMGGLAAMIYRASRRKKTSHV